MAPPSNRRPGFSRRAQYTTFIGYVIAAAGAVVGALLLLVSTRNAEAFSGARSLATDVTSPAGQAGASARTGGQGFLDNLAGYFLSGRENARLQKEVAVARVQLAEAAALREENKRLKDLLGLSQGDDRPVASARLIGSTASSTRRFATLGVGSDQGVRIGMPVRSPLGLVGRVLEVGHRTARVLLITDSESVVPVRRAGDGVAAFATGRGDGTVQLRLVNLGLNPLKRGDAFVTSGSGGLFRPGIAIAVVIKLTPDGAIAKPLSDPGSTEYVAIDPEWVEPETASEAQALASPAAGAN
jgi:rod shape-determining protein MreC